MINKKRLFKNAFFLIYGFGKSGSSSYKYLKKTNKCFLFDDNLKNIEKKYKKNIINFNQINSQKIDYIIISPGIDVSKCKLKNYLSLNRSKILTDLDIFSLCYPKNKKITITGTNGKSTTCTLLYKILKNHNLDVRLTGNIGNPILAEKKIFRKTIFIIEASSYQLDYSKYFSSNISVILNISPDHLERHYNFKNYIFSKFKILLNQKNIDYAIIEKKDKNLKRLIKKYKIKSRIKYINYSNKIFKDIKNIYFENPANRKNLTFIFEIAKILNLKKSKIIKIVNSFKGLKFRQQKVYNKKNLLIINDSKSTSFSSTTPLLEMHKNIFWILGGLAKKNDEFKLKSKYYNNIKAYIYGKNSNFYKHNLKNKIDFCVSKNLSDSLKRTFIDIKKKRDIKKVILFSPSAASFDQFKNFEERGKYFNRLIVNQITEYEKLF